MPKNVKFSDIADNKFRTEWVPVPEIDPDGRVLVRELTFQERADVIRTALATERRDNAVVFPSEEIAFLAALQDDDPETITIENPGTRLFPDRETIAGIPTAKRDFIFRIAGVVLRLTGITTVDGDGEKK